jgi:hypothetical protein
MCSGTDGLCSMVNWKLVFYVVWSMSILNCMSFLLYGELETDKCVWSTSILKYVQLMLSVCASFQVWCFVVCASGLGTDFDRTDYKLQITMNFCSGIQAMFRFNHTIWWFLHHSCLPIQKFLKYFLPSFIHVSQSLLFSLPYRVISYGDIVLVLQPFFKKFSSLIQLRQKDGKSFEGNPTACWCASPSPPTKCTSMYIIQHHN